MKLLATLILASVITTAATAEIPQTEAPSVVPEVGKAAPAFQLPTQTGDKIKLEELRGQWVVLYFYPRDATPGCTIEAHNFQRDLAEYQKRHAVVLGVSVDAVDSHQDFCTKEGLQFKLLADTEHTVTTAYGALKEREGTKYAARMTFLIDPAGVVRKVYPKVDVAKHSEEVLADLDALQSTK